MRVAVGSIFRESKPKSHDCSDHRFQRAHRGTDVGLGSTFFAFFGMSPACSSCITAQRRA